MKENNYRATYLVDGTEEKVTEFISTNPYDLESEHRRDAKVEIELREGIIPSRVTELKVKKLD